MALVSELCWQTLGTRVQKEKEEQEKCALKKEQDTFATSVLNMGTKSPTEWNAATGSQYRRCGQVLRLSPIKPHITSGLSP
jgi:hypothetical protein